MGTKSTKEAEQANSKAETISDLFALSKVDPQDGIDAVTLDGIIGHLRKASMQPDDWAAMDILHRVHWYQMVQDLVRKVGMSARRQSEILGEFYPLLNRNGDMRGAGISPPNGDDSSDSDSGSTNGSGSISGSDDSAHPALLLQELDELLANPHSYLVLAGWTRERLVRFDIGSLGAAVAADQDFIKKSTDYTPPPPVDLTNFVSTTAATSTSTSSSGSTSASTAMLKIDYWTLPESERAATARKVAGEYNRSLANTTGAAPATNAVPIAAFMANQKVAIRAVMAGYDFREPTGLARKLLGQTAVAIDLALGVASTLAGRGSSSITESTMQQSPDGFDNQGLKKL
ncbi:hypothetical protein GLA29479_5151 [Lysobacter antibioticus]|uniref:Uncharacterized protein n=1 Tax=Lysobacter antibioticus TaxID=84531 RepID=A0A0S2F5I7_LYSAN|nr:hypothetical protein [Lysobacter antibioticus]ALN65976.1 hypothetical protein GLA29479_5151 [Lysobacter antibioticus]ALN78799.1 hypothetical protein LA76x_0638 [Lysobacter antibioticus]